MYAKVFSQIFDSSIADDYQTRHVFMDLLVLADSTGTIDMTLSAIARRTNVPQDVVEKAIQVLLRPDEYSRTKDHEGRRLIPIDESRGWGWIIVNYCNYRELRDETMRREQNRNAQRRYKEKVSHGKPESAMVSHGKPESAHTEGEGEEEEDTERKTYVLPQSFGVWSVEDLRQSVIENNTDSLLTLEEVEDFVGYWSDKTKSGKMLFTTEKTWNTRRRIKTALNMIYLKKRPIGISTRTPVKPANLTQEEFTNLNLWREVLPKMSAKAKTAEEIEIVGKMKSSLKELEAKAAQ